MNQGWISLRPGEWGESSQRFPILLAGSTWAVVDQTTPPISTDGACADLAAVLKNRLRDDPPPSLAKLFPFPPAAIYDLPCSGPTVLTSDRSISSLLREDYGSNQWRFTFLLFTRSSPNQAELFCDLPIARHFEENRALVSHRTGKKAQTSFRRIGLGKTLQLWEAATTYLRPDQIRVHAMECGLSIAGETLYTESDPLNRADLPGTRKPGGSTHILFPGPAIHLASLNAPSLRKEPFQSAPPKPMLRWISHHFPSL